MSPVKYKKIYGLILSFGSSQFLKGGYNSMVTYHLYDDQDKRSEELLKEIKNELESL